MKVTIIIPNYNGEKFLKECLDSLKMQTFDDFHLILVDNASSDKSIDVAKSIFPKVEIIKFMENNGFSKAVNAGIKITRTEYVVLLNNDTVATEGWLENLVEKIESDSRIFSCSSKMIKYFNKNEIDDAGDAYTFFGWAYQTGHGKSISNYTIDRNIFSACAGAAIYRTEVFTEIGYFDESYFAYLEDVDVGYRAKIRGFKNVYCSSAEIYHIGSATSGHGLNSLKVNLTGRNGVFLYYKNQPLLQMMINFPFVLLGNIYRYFYYRKLGFGKAYLLGIKNGVSQLSDIEKSPFKVRFIKNYVTIQLEIMIAGFTFVSKKILRSIQNK